MTIRNRNNNYWKKFFEENDLPRDLSVNELRCKLSYLLRSVVKYCTLKRISIYRFPSLLYLYKEANDFKFVLRKDNKKVRDWIINEIFSEVELSDRIVPGILDKCLELRVHYPEYLTGLLLWAAEKLRVKIMKARSEDEVYILEMDIVNSGKYFHEERVLYGYLNHEVYYKGLHSIMGGLVLIKRKIEANNGYVFLEEGDAILAVFDQIENAVYTAYLLQKDLKKKKNIIEFRIGIGKGNLCVINKKTRYSYSIVEVKRITSRIRNGGVLISQNCFCELINRNNRLKDCNDCKKEKKNILEKNDLSDNDNNKLQECRIINKNLYTNKLSLCGIDIPIMPRGIINLKHTSHNLFEVLIGKELWVVL